MEMTMLKMIKTAAVAAVVGITALTGLSAAAQAEGMYLNYGGQRDARVGVYVGNGNAYHVDRSRHGRWDNGRRWNDDRRWDYRGFCTPQRALYKAERLGLHRARVVDVDRRSIDVAGRRHGHRVVMTFAKAPHCPVVRW
jgi:hypothetical protein